MHRDAAIAARRETRADLRSIDEVEVRRARVLVEAERQLEDAGAYLHRLELAIVEIHVAPFARADLVLNLVIDVTYPPLDPDAAAGDVEPSVLIAPDRSLRRPDVPLEPGLEVDAQPVARCDGRLLSEGRDGREGEQNGKNDRHVSVNAAEAVYERMFKTAGSFVN